VRTKADIGARLSALGLGLALVTLHAPAQSDSTWRDRSAAGDAARLRGDWKSYKHYAEILYRELNGYPSTIIALARADAQMHDTAGAMKWLKQYAATGLTKDIDADSLLAPVRGAPGWKELLARLAKNREAVGHPVVAFTVPDSEFVAEDIAYDSATKRFFVSSIRERKVVVRKDGKWSDFVPAGQDGAMSMMGLDADPARHALWATTAGMPEALALAPGDSGSSAVLRLDLATGALMRSYDLADDSSDHVFGDLTVAKNGDVFTSDATGGGVYVIRAGRDSLEELVPAGTFPNPQQPVAAPDGKRLFVADYIKGIAIVDRATGKVSWLANDAHAAISGIDGMVLTGRTLIAVQNGLTIDRVIRLDLDRGMTKIERWSTLAANLPSLREPNHGVMVGDKFYFIATSGWDRFAPDGTITKGATLYKPLIMVLEVR
jgi:hypothetical protein